MKNILLIGIVAIAVWTFSCSNEGFEPEGSEKVSCFIEASGKCDEVSKSTCGLMGGKVQSCTVKPPSSSSISSIFASSSSNIPPSSSSVPAGSSSGGSGVGSSSSVASGGSSSSSSSVLPSSSSSAIPEPDIQGELSFKDFSPSSSSGEI